MLDIMSNFNQEKITDCLQVRINQEKTKNVSSGFDYQGSSEEEEGDLLNDAETMAGDKDFIEYTFSDVKMVDG